MDFQSIKGISTRISTLEQDVNNLKSLTQFKEQQKKENVQKKEIVQVQKSSGEIPHTTYNIFSFTTFILLNKYISQGFQMIGYELPQQNCIINGGFKVLNDATYLLNKNILPDDLVYMNCFIQNALFNKEMQNMCFIQCQFNLTQKEKKQDNNSFLTEYNLNVSDSQFVDCVGYLTINLQCANQQEYDVLIKNCEFKQLKFIGNPIAKINVTVRNSFIERIVKEETDEIQITYEK